MMLEMGVGSDIKWVSRFKLNGILLMATFFLGRVLFLGVILGKYLLPTFIEYDYEQAFEDIGEGKMRWAQCLLIMFIILYFLNLFWFYKLVAGFLRYQKKAKYLAAQAEEKFEQVNELAEETLEKVTELKTELKEKAVEVK